MPIDLSTVNWVFVGLMAVFAFVASLVGTLISLSNRFVGAIIAGILFAVILWRGIITPTPPFRCRSSAAT